jgi:hypothetical protein
MNATPTAPRRKTSHKARRAPARPVAELLLEITYHLHTTRVVARPAPASAR